MEKKWRIIKNCIHYYNLVFDLGDFSVKGSLCPISMEISSKSLTDFQSREMSLVFNNRENCDTIRNEIRE